MHSHTLMDFEFKQIPPEEVKKYIEYLIGGGGITEIPLNADDEQRIKELILRLYYRDNYDRWQEEEALRRQQRETAELLRIKIERLEAGLPITPDVIPDRPSIPDSFYSEQVRMFRESEARKIEHHTEYGEWLVTEALSKSRAGCGASNGYYQQSKRRLATIKRVINNQRR